MSSGLAEATTLKSAQIAFLAEDERVTIIPLEQLPELPLLSGNVGPFEPPNEVDVPLWLAVRMKKQGQCKIVTPAWMTVEYLTKVEKLNQETFDESSRLPYHWTAISNLLLSVASDDIKSARQVSELLEHLWSKRANNMRKILMEFVGVADLIYDVDLTMLDLGSMELNTLRPFLLEAAAQLYSLHNTSVESVSNSYDSQAASFETSSRMRSQNGQPLPKQVRHDHQSSQF